MNKTELYKQFINNYQLQTHNEFKSIYSNNLYFFLKNNISGLIIESKNSNILKKSIEKLINDNNLRKKLSKNGILVAQKNFETDKSLENFSKIILQTLN